MTRYTISVGLVLCASASAEVIIDQIGPMDGSGLGELTASNQYFEPAFSDFDIAVLENIALEDATKIASIEFVLTGWDGFIDPTSITSYEANFYSDVELASTSLVGDVATSQIDIADVTIVGEWYGSGFLILAPFQAQLDGGEYWYSIIPANNFSQYGQIGVAETLLGDGTHSMQANPGEGFGFGTLRELTYETAYRINDNTIIDPCLVELPKACSEDIDGDGFVSIIDLLEVIGQWGSCGDGTYRPSADCAPLPLGDCCVNIADILAVVAAWGTECLPHGACCLPSGPCQEVVTEQYCLLAGGVYFGTNSQCGSQSCLAGACCIDDVTCFDSSNFECDNLSGVFKGDGTQCMNEDCSLLVAGDECTDAVEAYVGSTPFSTTLMSPSQPVPDDTLCYETNLDWANSPDMWFAFIAPTSDSFLFSLCDSNSFDTSLALYEGSCTNQVHCNGDAVDPDVEECQQFYSELSYALVQNETYFVRIGGWQGSSGDGTLTIELLPPPLPGACCFTNGTCVDAIEILECEAFGGVFMGGETDCATAACIVVDGDECDEAVEITIGAQPFTTEFATPSYPIPDETICPESFLEWLESPDIWLKWTAPDDGVAVFSTCDITSFDTSIVLYESTCTNQIACNGDAESNEECQIYYSEIEYPVTFGTEYYIRIGGWQGTVGEGTLTVSLEGINDVAACCYQGSCIENQTEMQCIDLSGQWQQGETCVSFNCDEIPCHSAVFIQTPHGPTDEWYAANATSDPASGMNYTRAEHVNAPSTSSVTVWGLQAYFNGSSWSSCDSDYEFTVRTYENSKGLPGPMTAESLNTIATKTATGTLYAGAYELIKWDIPFQAMNVEHLSIQSESDGLNCWLLWLSSGTGDGNSSVNSGTGWTFQNYDLSICIE